MHCIPVHGHLHLLSSKTKVSNLLSCTLNHRPVGGKLFVFKPNTPYIIGLVFARFLLSLGTCGYHPWNTIQIVMHKTKIATPFRPVESAIALGEDLNFFLFSWWFCWLLTGVEVIGFANGRTLMAHSIPVFQLTSRVTDWKRRDHELIKSELSDE